MAATEPALIVGGYRLAMDVAYRCTRWPGIAVRLIDADYDESYVWDYENECEQEVYRWAGTVVVRMIGDDRDWSVEPDELEPIDHYCAGCGATNCEWG